MESPRHDVVRGIIPKISQNGMFFRDYFNFTFFSQNIWPQFLSNSIQCRRQMIAPSNLLRFHQESDRFGNSPEVWTIPCFLQEIIYKWWIFSPAPRLPRSFWPLVMIGSATALFCRPNLMECNVGAEGTVVGLTKTNIKKRISPAKCWLRRQHNLGISVKDVKVCVAITNGLNWTHSARLLVATLAVGQLGTTYQLQPTCLAKWPYAWA